MPRDLLLITDGEVWDTDSAVAEARASGHRIFTVGVGSAVAEPFVRALAQATGGACELVAPREDMAGRIHRHFQRILAPPATRVRVVWPAPVRHAVPDPLPPPYPGDTMHLFGTFAERPNGPVVLELELADGRTIGHRLEIGPPPRRNQVAAASARSDLARMGAAVRLPVIDDQAAATELAVRYQLISEWTDCLVVHIRAQDDKADGLPTLAKVPHIPAAGWHGIGTVHDASPLRADAAYSQAPPPDAMLSPLPATAGSPFGIVAALNDRSLPSTPTIEDLASIGVPDDLMVRLRDLVDAGEDAHAVAVIFLYLICQSPAGSGLDRRQRRLILSAYKQLRPGKATVTAVRSVWRAWGIRGAVI